MRRTISNAPVNCHHNTLAENKLRRLCAKFLRTFVNAIFLLSLFSIFFPFSRSLFSCAPFSFCPILHRSSFFQVPLGNTFVTRISCRHVLSIILKLIIHSWLTFHTSRPTDLNNKSSYDLLDEENSVTNWLISLPLLRFTLEINFWKKYFNRKLTLLLGKIVWLLPNLVFLSFHYFISNVFLHFKNFLKVRNKVLAVGVCSLALATSQNSSTF